MSELERAGEEWTKEEQSELIVEFIEFLKLQSKIHQRTPGAIAARIELIQDRSQEYFDRLRGRR